jgi:hypothetical protein
MEGGRWRRNTVVVLIALDKNRDSGVVVSIHVDEGSVTLRRGHTPNTAQNDVSSLEIAFVLAHGEIARAETVIAASLLLHRRATVGS